MKKINNKEKNYAGIPYLYRKKGAVSTVVELNMKDEVDGVLLQKSLNEAVKYHPYLSSTIIEEKGERFLTECNIPFEVTRTDSLRKLGSRETRYHLIDVTYWDKKIFIAFHHVLCDGTGIKMLTELMMSLYLSKKYKVKDYKVRQELLVSINDNLDPFSGSRYKIDKKKKMPKVVSKGMALKEVPDKMRDDIDFRYSFILDNDSLVRFAKENAASPAIIISILLSRSIKNLNMDEELPVVFNMVSNLREPLLAEGSFKNVVNSIYLPYDKTSENHGTAKLAKEYRRMIAEQKEENYVKKCANTMIGLFKITNILPTIKIKQKALSFFENIKINTYILSYPGRLDFAGLESYVESAHLYSSGNNGFFVNVMSVAKTTSIDMIQSFPEETYIKEFKRQLDLAGIAYEMVKKDEFVTPRDGIMDDPMAS